MCFMYSLEWPYRGDSNGYTKHTFILLTIETSKNYPICLLARRSNYSCLDLISMVPKMLESLKFDFIQNIGNIQKERNGLLDFSLFFFLLTLILDGVV